MASATGEAIWDNDLLTGRQEWDGATEALFGYPPHSDGTGGWWEERVHPKDRGRVLSGLAAVLDGKGELWEEEYRFRRADGSYAHVLDRGIVVRDGEGRPIRMVGAMADVTERRKTERVLRESEERYRFAFQEAPVGMAHVAPDGCWLRVNKRLCDIIGYRREALSVLTLLDLTHPDELDASVECTRSLLAEEIGPYSVERRFRRNDGSWVWVDLKVSLARGPLGEPIFFCCMIEDITRHKLAELVPDPLTCRESEVLLRVAAGRSDPQVAQDLCYSLGTVKRDLRSVLCKLGVRSRNQAAERAVAIGLIAPQTSEQETCKTGPSFDPTHFLVRPTIDTARSAVDTVLHVARRPPPRVAQRKEQYGQESGE